MERYPGTPCWQHRGRSFGPAAERYDRIRPSYPVEALRWILGDQPSRVVDLGAGTGILTRQLVALGHEVIPVEPDPAMRALIPAELAPRDGTAEAIPLPDASVDAVVAGQAYHWFDQDKAHPEIARVLRPGGVFGPLWNERDDSVDWIRSYYLVSTAQRQREIEAAIRQLVATHPDLAGRDTFELWYVTDTYRASVVALEDQA